MAIQESILGAISGVQKASAVGKALEEQKKQTQIADVKAGAEKALAEEKEKSAKALEKEKAKTTALEQQLQAQRQGLFSAEKKVAEEGKQAKKDIAETKKKIKETDAKIKELEEGLAQTQKETETARKGHKKSSHLVERGKAQEGALKQAREERKKHEEALQGYTELTQNIRAKEASIAIFREALGIGGRR